MELVTDNHPFFQLRGELGPLHGNGDMAEAMVVTEFAAPCVIDELVGFRPNRNPALYILHPKPKPVKQFDGMEPNAAHFPGDMVPEIRKPAVLRSDDLHIFPCVQIDWKRVSAACFFHQFLLFLP